MENNIIKKPDNAKLTKEIITYQIQDVEDKRMMLCDRQLLLDKLALEEIIKDYQIKAKNRQTQKALIKSLIDKM